VLGGTPFYEEWVQGELVPIVALLRVYAQAAVQKADQAWGDDQGARDRVNRSLDLIRQVVYVFTLERSLAGQHLK